MEDYLYQSRIKSIKGRDSIKITISIMLTCSVCNRMIANKTLLKRHKTRGKCNSTSKSNDTSKNKEPILTTKKEPISPIKSKEAADKVFAKGYHSDGDIDELKNEINPYSKLENSTKNEQRISLMISCMYCDKMFANRNSLRTHRYNFHSKKRTRENKQKEDDEQRLNDKMQQTDPRINLFKAYDIKMKIYRKMIVNPRWKYETLSIYQQVLVNVIMEVPELKTVCDVLNQNSETIKQIMKLI